VVALGWDPTRGQMASYPQLSVVALKRNAWGAFDNNRRVNLFPLPLGEGQGEGVSFGVPYIYYM
jgi:hypothetical protein